MPEEASQMRLIGPLRNRIRYRFDNLLARGTWAVLVFLGAVTLVALIFSAVMLAIAGVTFAGSEGSSFLEDFWQSMLRVIDPGTMVADVGWGRRLLALLVTIFGILVAGTLIGLIANGVEQRVDEMQRGRSVVVESDHVLILGASPRLAVITDQLTLARRARRGNTIVVLADHEPRELSDKVRALVSDTRGTRLVFRSGDPTRRADLAIACVEKARVVIALTAEDAPGDAGVVKSVLAVGAELGGFDRVPIIAELSDLGTAESLAAACGGQVYSLVPLQGIARVTAFMLRAPGLSEVVEELLDYRGCDIYVRPVGEHAGSRFGDLVYRFSKARPIGRMRGDGEVELNPPEQTVLAADDRLVIIADDDHETLADSPFPPRQDLRRGVPRAVHDRPRKEHYLIIGWNSLGRQLLDQLQEIVAPGSTVNVVYDARLLEPEEVNAPSTARLAVTVTPTRADTWQPADASRMADLTSVVFLGYRRGVSVAESDSRTLLNLMLLKRALRAHGVAAPRIVAELLDSDNVELARTTGADDFVVSDAIASRLIAQLAEQPLRRPVVLTLYAVDGPSIHLLPATELGASVEQSWHEIVAAAYAAGLLAIGWRRSTSQEGQLTLNPNAADRVHLRDGDQVVVIG